MSRGRQVLLYMDTPLTRWRIRLTDQLQREGKLPVGLDFNVVRRANVARRNRWHGEGEWPGVAWSNAMCGEAGEAANVVKKMYRHESQIESNYNTPELIELRPMLAEELADVVLYADLLAAHYDIDLSMAVVAKFNKVSAAQGFPERLPPPESVPMEGDR